MDYAGYSSVASGQRGRWHEVENTSSTVVGKLSWNLGSSFNGHLVCQTTSARRTTARPGPSAKHQKDRLRWSNRREKAETKLASTTAFQKHFHKALSSNLWPEDDGAVDQYPLAVRPPSDGLKAYAGNPANATVYSLTSGMKRQRVDSYSAGAGNLETPTKRRRMTEDGSDLSLADSDEDIDDLEAAFDDLHVAREIWTLRTH